MGWGTTFKPEVYLTRVHYKTMDEIDEKIEELTKAIESSKQTISMMVSSTPKDIVKTDEEGCVISDIQVNLNETFEFLEEELYNLSMVSLLKQHVEENGFEDVLTD